jgi:serine/threonine protein kinase/Tol biopolymer transport system component
MPLAPGSKFGHFQITAVLGAGGMGEVYRGVDTRLKRDVALKVLPDFFLNDAQRMARFEREAQLVAALNHPNIAAIYGLEESDGVRALVMELVEGRTLAERVALSSTGDNKGTPIPLEETLAITKQIAEALEYSHERGIIHRDLKPANVKVKADGEVKVLDFGLAKALADDPSSGDISTSPTLSVAATRAGLILGTAAYMAPEQARGKSVDRRADIWSFGVVFYEMLTGQQLFSGETVSDSLAAVITKQPDWSALPKCTPAPIRQLLQRCLEKDPRRRLQAIGEARYAIEEAIANPATQETPSSAAAAVMVPFWRSAVPWATAAFFALLALAALWHPWVKPNSARFIRLSTELGADGSLPTGFGPSEVLSPDGTRIAFVLPDMSQRARIYLRSLDQLSAAPLGGTEDARNPFFSPDGQWIAFFSNGKLKKVAVQGGAAVTLCDVQDDRGGAWGEDGTIVFAPSPRAGLSRVSSGGGTPRQFSILDKQAGEVTHRWPQFLPGGKAVLFTSSSHGQNYEDAGAIVQVLATGQKKKILQGGFYARYVASGHLVYMHDDTLFAVPFDLKRLETSGQPLPILEQVMNNNGTAGAQFSFSQAGLFVYVPGRGVANRFSIYWLTRDGKTQPLRETPASYSSPSFSPDGKFLASSISTGRRTHIWVYFWERDTLTRLTFTDDSNDFPAWTPDGKRIAYAVTTDSGLFNISWKRADGAGEAQRLIEGKSSLLQPSWSPDGRTLAFVELNSDTSGDIMTLTVEGDEKTGWKPGAPRPFLNTPFGEYSPAFSPDGRWLAYMSNESGTYEVYVRPFPGPGGKWQVSTGGGVFPQWSRTSRELFYRTFENKIMVASYFVAGDSFRAEKPTFWSNVQLLDLGAFTRNFVLHPDGKRIAILRSPGAETQSRITKVTFIFNFFGEIRSKFVP